MSELLVARDENIVTLTLNRPEAGNSFSRAMLAAFADAIASLREDRDARALILTAAGDRIFCAGADLKERAGMSVDDVKTAVTTIRETISAFAALPMPVIAALNGAALGGGTELALACDIRVASPSATLGLTETTLAIIPGGGGTQRLPRLVGPGRAKELIFTGRRVDANEALRIGLVEEVADDPLARAREIAMRIAANGPVAVRAAKEAVDRGLRLPLEEALRLETELYGRTIETKDRTEGLTAFREKRAPRYTGE
jgi:enoyl-CoA hydratase/carnithine racemase